MQTEADIGDVSEEVVLARGKTVDPCLFQVLSMKGSQCDSDSQLTGKDGGYCLPVQAECFHWSHVERVVNRYII